MTYLTLSFLIYFWPVAGSEGKKKIVKFVFSLFYYDPNTQALLNRKWQLQNFGGWVVQHPHQVHDNSLSLISFTSFAATPTPLRC